MSRMAKFVGFVCSISIAISTAAVLCSSRGPTSVTPSAAGATPPADSGTIGCPAEVASTSEILATLSSLPLRFDENLGQTDPAVRFVHRAPDATVFLTPSETVFALLGEEKTGVVRMRFAGGSREPVLTGEDELPGRTNHLRGDDPSRWTTNVRGFGSVRCRAVYPGVDIVFHGRAGVLEYDFVVAPGADPTPIALEFEGVTSVRVDESGDLLLDNDAGTLRQRRPTVYQDSHSGRREVEGRYTVREDGRVAFSLAEYDAARPLVIDPQLVFSTYLGGNSRTVPFGVAVSQDGHVFVTGDTFSTDFPTTTGAKQTSYGGGGPAIAFSNTSFISGDAFVTKLNAAGTALVYSTYLGGSADDLGFAIAVDVDNHAYVAGRTASTNFPVTAGAFQTANSAGDYAGFVSKLAADGASLVYSTYVGQSGLDEVHAIAVDSGSQEVCLTGRASVGASGPTMTLATPGALDAVAHPTRGDCFVAKLNAAGSAFVFFTYLGDGGEVGYGVRYAPRTHPEQQGADVVVAGATDGGLPATPGAFQTTYGGGQRDGFVSRFGPAGEHRWTTYLGGPVTPFWNTGADYCTSVASAPDGTVYVTGATQSRGFPSTAGAYQSAPADSNAFVARLRADGSGLVYSTFLRANPDSAGWAITLDAVGAAYVMGRAADGFPAVGTALPFAPSGGFRVFVAKLDPSGATLEYSSRFGGSGQTSTSIQREFCGGLSRHPSASSLVIAGYTAATDFPVTPGAFRTTAPSGVLLQSGTTILGSTAWVARISPDTPNDGEPPVVAILTPTSDAVVGSADLRVDVSVTDASATSVSSSPAASWTPADLPAGGGATSALVTLPAGDGEKFVSVSARDAAGNVGGTAVRVVLDTTAPEFTLVSPVSGTVTALPTVGVRVDVSDLTATTVEIDGQSTSLPAGSGTADVAIELEPGPNSIVIRAIDAAGNHNERTVVVALDVEAPVVRILEPANGALFGPGQEDVPVLASVDDLSATHVDSQPLGVLGDLPAGGAVAHGYVSLEEGANSIRVVATDESGLAGEDTVVVVLDTTAPSVGFVSPSSLMALRGEVDVEIAADDGLMGSGVESVDVFCDGSRVASWDVPPYRFVLDTATLDTDGPKILRAVAQDRMGLWSAVEIVVVADNSPPEVMIYRPLAGALVAGTVPFEASVLDVGSGVREVRFQVNGVPATTGGTMAFSPPLTPLTGGVVGATVDTAQWPDGQAIFRVEVLDAAGNSAAAEVPTFIDNTRPSNLRILSPADRAVVSGTISITAEAVDADIASVRLFVDGVEVAGSPGPFVSAQFDTQTRLDGTMQIEVRAWDAAGNMSTRGISVQLDNIQLVSAPGVLNLQQVNGAAFSVLLGGPNLSLTMPPEDHTFQLLIPGGNAVTASAVTLLSTGRLRVEFPRAAVVASARAGIANAFDFVTCRVLVDGRAQILWLLKLVGKH